MDERDLAGDALWYSATEWRDREEDYGNDAALTLVIDGSPMYPVLNLTHPADHATYEEFSRCVESLGYWFELGYSWSVHFYPRRGGPASGAPRP
jgi:hypothetical protein